MHKSAPVWLMGLTNSIFGIFGGFVAISMPQLLAARHVPAATIAATSAVVLSPSFWAFLLSPLLDVRFSRRWYSGATALAASLLLMAAMFCLSHLLVFEVLLTAGFLCATLNLSAIGGWLASIVRTTDDERRLSVWVNVGLVGVGGAMATVVSELMQVLSLDWVAVILGAAILAPTLVFPWMPAPAADISGARGSFAKLRADVVTLLKRRAVLLALLLFVSPVATFSLTNFLSGVGDDFHASPRFVGIISGTGVAVAGVCGCFSFALIDRLLPSRFLYLAIGVVGSLFTFALVLLPKTPIAFALAVIGQNVFQSLAFTAGTAIQFEAIGRNNPLSATAWCLMVSAYDIPISYMLLVDGSGYAWRGVSGSLLADGGASLLACLLLGGYLVLGRRSSADGAQLREREVARTPS